METLGYDDVLTDPKDRTSGTPTHIRFFRSFVEGNYFYVFSALLMMLGSYLVMSSSWVHGTAFDRTLRSLSILQGYELLIIATALLIVARFRRLGDAFTLLVIELVLLLDPTFFSNAFTTIPNAEVPPFDVRWVNAGCFLFMIIKLGVLQRFLHLRFSPRALLALVSAAFFVYLAEGPLNREGGALTRQGYYYLLGWAPLALAALFPPAGETVAVCRLRGGFITERQAAWLPRFVVGLPLLIAAFHFIESANVYGIRFYWSYGAPLLLALGVVVAKNWKQWEAAAGVLILDVLCGLAILLSLPVVSIEGKAAIHGASIPAPGFLESIQPVAACALAAIGLYGYYAWKHEYRPALVRIAVLVAGAGLYAFVKSGAIGYGVDRMGDLISWTVSVIAAHPRTISIVAWMFLLALAVRFSSYGTWLIFGLYSIVFLASYLPGTLDRWIPEMLEATLLLGLVLSHALGGPGDRPERTVAAVFLAGIGLVRFLSAEMEWAGIVAAGECVGLIVAGLSFRHRGYVATGALQGLILGGFVGRDLPRHIPPAAAVLGAGLVLFVVGVLVTFHKERILDWFARWAEASRINGPVPATATGHSSTATLPVAPATPPPRRPTEDRERSGGEPRTGSDEEDNLLPIGPPVTPPPDLECYIQQPLWPEDEDTGEADRDEKKPGEAAEDDEGPGYWVDVSLVDDDTTEIRSDSPSLPTEEEEGYESLPRPPLAERMQIPEWEEEPPMETTIHTTTRIDRVRILKSLFVTDTQTGIFLEEDLDSRNLTAAAEGVDWFPGEALVVSFSAVEEKTRPWPVMLTSLRLVYRPPDRQGPISVYYPQIAYISRQLGTLLFTGHAGQVLMCHGLSVDQAAILKRGLEKLLAETALEPPSEDYR